MGAFDDIPATTIDAISDFSPIKFNTIQNDEQEKLEMTSTTAIDEEITFMARKTENLKCEERLQRKSDDDICNTPKRERHEDQKLNIRSARLLGIEEESSRNDKDNYDESDGDVLMKTPKKKGEIVKSLSFEFEQRLASIHVSPKTTLTNSGYSMNSVNVTSTTTTATATATTAGPTPTITVSSNAIPSINPKPVRSMSPIRSVAQLSPVSKLNLNDNTAVEETINFTIETPKLVSPSKIVAAASAIDIQKIKNELESEVT
jgi:hypothetical protein